MTESAKRKRLLLIGATGSIGKSTLDVVREQRNDFEIAGLSAHSNAVLLLEQAAEFRPRALAIEQTADIDGFVKASRDIGVERFFYGDGATVQLVQSESYDLLVNAMMGNAGISPTLAALNRGIDVALANKETLVAAGPLVMNAARINGARLVPIDSEHSAILQCMTGEEPKHVRKIWITTSGGPFWGKRAEDLQQVTVEQALNHPRWKMGPKITIDSATLFNKGLEVIETQRLFDLPVESIGVVRHAEHIIHSFVEFIDGSFKAQLSTPDMRLPILYALTSPLRVQSNLVKTDPGAFSTLHFEPVEIEQYPCLKLAYVALARGGDVPAALSAADETAVAAFLKKQICFNDIAHVISGVLEAWRDGAISTADEVVHADRKSRLAAAKIIDSICQTTGEKICC
jgi:1-deoxy-D-xylulose-5-phosphate reductoisomerase